MFTVFLMVMIGWIFSLTLHEFAHALVAYWGGDSSVRDKGYLTFNPLRYTHPVYSLVLPVLFLLMGGIGLPGGAVYIETWRLRNSKWESAVSLAGPLANLLLAAIIGLLFRFGLVGGDVLGLSLAFLGLLQVTAALFNLLPIPPFDGFGALRPQLNLVLRRQMDEFSRISMWVVLALFWFVPVVGGLFWTLVGMLARALGIPPELAIQGQNAFLFWH